MVRTFKIFGKRLAQLRRDAGFTQASFAAAVGITESAVYKIEREEVATVFNSTRRIMAEKPWMISAVAANRAAGFAVDPSLGAAVDRKVAAEAKASEVLKGRVVRETHAAYLFEIAGCGIVEPREAWFPKSQVQLLEGYIVVPAWLAAKN